MHAVGLFFLQPSPCRRTLPSYRSDKWLCVSSSAFPHNPRRSPISFGEKITCPGLYRNDHGRRGVRPDVDLVSHTSRDTPCLYFWQRKGALSLAQLAPFFLRFAIPYASIGMACTANARAAFRCVRFKSIGSVHPLSLREFAEAVFKDAMAATRTKNGTDQSSALGEFMFSAAEIPFRTIAFFSGAWLGLFLMNRERYIFPAIVYQNNALTLTFISGTFKIFTSLTYS